MARFILIEPSHNGNVGAAARALKTMGFDDMWLVNPRDARVLNREETKQRASGATDVLEKAKIVAKLEDAFEGVNHLCATAMIGRDFGPFTFAPRMYFESLLKKELFAHNPPSKNDDLALKKDIKIAFLFGTERFGMKNEDVYRCHAALSIPTNPQYGSLNLASAVQLIAYEWRQALGGYEIPASENSALADAAQVQGALAHWQEALISLGFLDPVAPKKLMPRLNALLNRAQLQQEEIHILRGIAKTILQTSPNSQSTKKEP